MTAERGCVYPFWYNFYEKLDLDFDFLLNKGCKKSGWSLIKQASAIEWKCHSLFYFENKINSRLKEIQIVAGPSYHSNCA